LSRPRHRHALPRRPWYGPDKLRAAYLAGQGASAGEIARAIGGTTGPRVRAMLRVHAIPLLRENSGEDILCVRWKVADRERLNATADKLDRDPGDLAALIVRKVLAADPSLLRELVHDLDVV
jgi:hypothetical protein